MKSRRLFGVEYVLLPLALIYGIVMRVRNFLYDKKILPSFSPPNARVVSVGNLTAGGTGKTPIVAMIANELRRRGHVVGVVSRGYGGRVIGPAKVAEDRPEDFGDEPTLLAKQLEGVPVYVSRDRVAGAEALVSVEKVGVVISDDGFQHRRLRRQADVVVIDATQPMSEYASLPLGRAREGFSSLSRASAIFITKTNLASTEELQALRRRIEPYRSPYQVPVFEFESLIDGFSDLSVEDPSAPIRQANLKERRAFLVSAIGRPFAFEKLVERASGALIVEHSIFRDHHAYTEEELKKIEARAEEIKADVIVTTEKDAVKLRGWKPKTIPVLVSRLVTRPTGDMDSIYDAVTKSAVRN